RPEAFKPGMWLLVLVLLTAAFSGALAATGSRGGITVALGAGAVVFVALLVARRGLSEPGALPRLGAAVAALVVTTLALSTPLRSRAEATGGGGLPPELCPAVSQASTADSNRFRVLTWQGTLNMGKRRPLLGWGAGTFETAFPPNQVAGYTRQAHNSYLQLFAEQGAAGPVAWGLLLLCALVGCFLFPRGPEWAWSAAVGGALGAAAAHNLLDSLLFVPAVAFLTWALLGLGMAGWGVRATESQGSGDGGRRRDRGTGRDAKRARMVWVGVAVLGLFAAGWHALGRGLYQSGRAELESGHAPAAAETLAAARSFLPLDHQVAIADAQALRAQGRWQEALDEGLRALRLAPYRPPTYQFIGEMRKFLGRPDIALLQYEAGLKVAPREVQLLYPYALLLEQQGRRAEALDVYGRIVAVEESPMGRVRALGEVRDYRFARAHEALAGEAVLKQRPAEAFEHRKAAACLLGERRRLFTANPVSYVSMGDWDPQTEHELRGEEERLWQQLAQEYRARGENRLAELSSEQAADVEKSREPLEKIIEELGR
ncbi:MAG TPA: O-antigen ligase family protein, partial [Armatimonadota bacterium]|nr:O-antigen ligase family protein [Armatimonadota bacterium]